MSVPYNPSYRNGMGHGDPLGGISPVSSFNFVPCVLANGNVSMSAFDPSAGFNDPNDGGFYYFRVEEVKTMRYPTFRRAGIIYRDLGPATVQLNMTAVDDNGQVNSKTLPFQIGTSKATGRLCAKFLDIELTGFLPQVGIIRPAGAGPISISKLWISTEVEDTTL